MARSATVAKNPVAKKPVAKKPVAKNPVAKNPVAKNPVAKNPVAKNPVAKNPVAKNPVAKKLAATTSSGRTWVTRREYDAWIAECAALAIACRYPVHAEMINDNTGLVFGEDQYQAFVNGVWSREAYEVFAIFQALNEPAVHGLPKGGLEWAQFGGLCDKLMIVHPGKFCSPHLHWRKTEFYEIVLGEMELYYAPDIIEDERLHVSRKDLIFSHPMPRGEKRPKGIVLPTGREHTYERLTEYRCLRPGDPKFVMHRKHLHAFGCPRDAITPVVIREGSAYSHEPTATGKATILKDWQHIHDNGFLLDGLDEGRLKNNIREE